MSQQASHGTMGPGPAKGAGRPQAARQASAWTVVAVTLYLVVVAAVAVGALLRYWPDPEAGAAGLLNEPNIRLFVIVMAMGVIGGFVHAATSLATYAGNRRFYKSWVLWMVLRPPIGLTLALIVYLVLLGGLVQGDEDSLRKPGVAAIAGLAGMFSKQAIDKLREVFDNLFKSEPDARGDKLDHGVPRLASVTPAVLKAGQSERKLRLTGETFTEDCEARIAGQARPTRYVDAATLEATLADADVAGARTLEVTVHNRASGKTSEAVELKVEAQSASP